MWHRAELDSAHYGRDSEAEETESNEAHSAQSNEGSAVAAVSTAVLTWDGRKERKLVEFLNTYTIL